MGSNIRSKIILASASPRRKELLSRAEVKFDICLKSVDETVPAGMDPAQGAEHTAAVKAMAVSFINNDAIVIGADTVVVLDDEVLGKPRDKDDAVEMLRKLSLPRLSTDAGMYTSSIGQPSNACCPITFRPSYSSTEDRFRQ